MNSRVDVPGERLAAASAALDSVRKRLLEPSPQALDECAVKLSEAAEKIRRMDGAEQGHELVVNLKNDLAEVRALLEQAGALYLGWVRLLHSSTGIYDSGGDLRAPDGATVSVEG